jgi:hypothetical protein
VIHQTSNKGTGTLFESNSGFLQTRVPKTGKQKTKTVTKTEKNRKKNKKQ